MDKVHDKFLVFIIFNVMYRMEDLSEEWEEYSPPEGSGKMSWILNKGLNLGKKIVISGIVMSSAPLVLPPLVVFSALGLALSVPFGLFFTSYACTEKLMSKLLSTPASPHTLEYETWPSDDDDICGYAEEDMEFGEIIDFEEEEKRLRKDTEEGVGFMIELTDEGNEGFDQEGKPTEEEKYEQGGVGTKEQEQEKDVYEIVKEEGYEEDNEDLVKENVKPLGEIDMKVGESREENVGDIEEKREQVMEESKDQKHKDEVRGVIIVMEGDEENDINVEVGEPFGVTRGANEEVKGAEKVSEIEEAEKLVRETRALKESIRDAGYIGTAEEDDKQRVKEKRGATEDKDNRNVGYLKKMEKPSGSRKKKPVHNLGGAVKKKDEEILNKLKETKERRHEGNIGSIPKVVKPVEEIEGTQKKINASGKHADHIVKVEIPQEETRTRQTSNVGSTVDQKQKPKVDKKAMLKGRREDGIVNESGFDLVDKKNTANKQYSDSVMETTEGTH